MPVPSLSEEQRRQARLAATAARRTRAELKRALAAGELTLASALEKADHDDIIAHIRVVDVLKAIPRIGPKRAEGLMIRLKIAPGRRLRGLGHEQRAKLQDAIR